MSSFTTVSCRGTYCNQQVDSPGEKCHDCSFITQGQKCMNKFCRDNLDGTVSQAPAVSGRRDGLCINCHKKHVKMICRYGDCSNYMVLSRKDHFCEFHHSFKNRSLNGFSN